MGADAVHEVVGPLVRAFWDYPETVHLLPNEESRRRVLPRYLESDTRDAARFGTLLAAVEAGKVVGAAAWQLPGGYPLGRRRSLRQIRDVAPTLPWTFREAREAGRGQRANRSRHRPHPPHFWLQVIGIDPDHQHTGVGAALLRPVLDRADHEGAGSFLFTATPENAAWYKRFGFRTEAEYQPTPRWPTVWAMWRAPVG